MADFEINNCPTCGKKALLLPDAIYNMNDGNFTDYGIYCQSNDKCSMELVICLKDGYDFNSELMIKLWNSIKGE